LYGVLVQPLVGPSSFVLVLDLVIVDVVWLHDHRILKTIAITAAVTAATSAARSAPRRNLFRPNNTIRRSVASDMAIMISALPVAVPIKRTKTLITPNRSSLRESVGT